MSLSTDVDDDARRRARRRRSARLSVTIAVLLVALLGGGYVAAVASAPLPALQAHLTVDAETSFEADESGAQAAVANQSLPTAIGWADGEAVWANDETAYTLASISKLITVLVCLEAEPLEPGADGPTYTWTAEDKARQDQYIAMNGVAYPIPIGTEITLRQMLQFIFLPSSNDYAAAYAYRVFPDNEAFLAAVRAWAAKHGLTSVNLVEPTGMDDLNRASAADLVRIARIALDNPTIREFNGMQSAEMPWGVGLIENTNPLLGHVPGVIGVKTGALDNVGYNFIAAQELNVHGRDIVSISVTLARPSMEARADSGREMLGLMAPLPGTHEYVAEGEELGAVITWQGERIALLASTGAESVLLPGESARRTVEIRSVSSASAGSVVGEVRLEAPTDIEPVPIRLAAPITEPDLWWRLTHPAIVFGWQGPQSPSRSV